jgi:hypothetical protein
MGAYRSGVCVTVFLSSRRVAQSAPQPGNSAEHDFENAPPRCEPEYTGHGYNDDLVCLVVSAGHGDADHHKGKHRSGRKHHPLTDSRGLQGICRNNRKTNKNSGTNRSCSVSTHEKGHKIGTHKRLVRRGSETSSSRDFDRWAEYWSGESTFQWRRQEFFTDASGGYYGQRETVGAQEMPTDARLRRGRTSARDDSFHERTRKARTTKIRVTRYGAGRCTASGRRSCRSTRE